jgi:hypothetical protein
MAVEAKALLLTAFLAVTLLAAAPQPAAGKGDKGAAAQHNTTFSTCNTGNRGVACYWASLLAASIAYSACAIALGA